MFFVGAEFCPFCAAERWPLVVALARFGTFTALHDTVSSPQTVFPNTPSFSFVGVAYSSPWVTLTGVELYSNQTGPDGSFLRLGHLTAAQAAIADQSQAQIADAVVHPAGPTEPPTGQAVLAVANQLSAGICASTGQLPARVCRSKAVLAADAALGLPRPDPLPTS